MNFFEEKSWKVSLPSNEFCFCVSLAYLIPIFTVENPISHVIKNSNTKVDEITWMIEKNILLG